MGPFTSSKKGVEHVDLSALEQLSPKGARGEAQRIVAEARERAEHMLADARLARDAEIEAARTQGYERGYTEGMEAADRDSAGLLAAAEAIAEKLASEREALLDRSEEEVVKLAAAMAVKMCNAAVELEPGRVLEVCRGAMRKAFLRETLVVLAHPEDLEVLRAGGPEVAQQLGGVRHLDFVEERRLDRGSVIVRTPAGEVDATFGGKADKIVSDLKSLMDSRRAGQ